MSYDSRLSQTVFMCAFIIFYILTIQSSFTFGTALLTSSGAYSDFKTIPNCSRDYFMNGTAVDSRSRSVRSEVECAQVCARVAQCFSYNVLQDGASSTIGRMVCELLESSTTSCTGLTARARCVFKYKKMEITTSTTSTTDKIETTTSAATTTAATATAATTTAATTAAATTAAATTAAATITASTTPTATTTAALTTAPTTTDTVTTTTTTPTTTDKITTTTTAPKTTDKITTTTTAPTTTDKITTTTTAPTTTDKITITTTAPTTTDKITSTTAPTTTDNITTTTTDKITTTTTAPTTTDKITTTTTAPTTTDKITSTTAPITTDKITTTTSAPTTTAKITTTTTAPTTTDKITTTTTAPTTTDKITTTTTAPTTTDKITTTTTTPTTTDKITTTTTAPTTTDKTTTTSAPTTTDKITTTTTAPTTTDKATATTAAATTTTTGKWTSTTTTAATTDTKTSSRDETNTSSTDTTTILTSSTTESINNDNWALVFTTNQTTTSASLSDLREALKAGRRVAVLVRDPSGRQYVILGLDFVVTPSDVCLHLPLFVRTPQWSKLGDTASWLFGDICASGSTTIFSQTQKNGKSVDVEVSWFTQRCAAASSPGTCCEQQDVMTNLNDGSVYKGDFNTLQKEMTSGHSLTVIYHDLNAGQGKKAKETWDNYNVYMRQTVVVASSVSKIGAQRLWAFSQMSKNTEAYLDVTMSVTDSEDTNVGWSLETHTVVQTSNKQNSKHSWLVNPCWDVIYSAGSSATGGQSPYGSHADLVSTVRAGHRVRVTISETDQTILAEADHVVITPQGVVIAQILSNMVTDQLTFTSDGQWGWYFVHSSGYQCLFQVPISSQSVASSSCQAVNASWFTDRTQRDVMLETDMAGSVVRGSVVSLRQSVENMGQLRVKVVLSTEPGLERYLSINSAELGPNSALSASSMTILATTFGSDQLMKLDSSTYGLVMLVTSTGRVQIQNWKVGSLVPKTQRETSASVTWFVNR